MDFCTLKSVKLLITSTPPPQKMSLAHLSPKVDRDRRPGYRVQDVKRSLARRALLTQHHYSEASDLIHYITGKHTHTRTHTQGLDYNHGKNGRYVAVSRLRAPAAYLYYPVMSTTHLVASRHARRQRHRSVFLVLNIVTWTKDKKKQ